MLTRLCAVGSFTVGYHYHRYGWSCCWHDAESGDGKGTSSFVLDSPFPRARRQQIPLGTDNVDHDGSCSHNAVVALPGTVPSPPG